MSESNGSSVAAIAKRHFNEVQEIAGAIDLSVLDEIVTCLRNARLRGAMVYVMGNGGSAATASHMATDIGKNTSIPGKDPIKIISLGDNLPWVTALSNDEGYDKVFSGQLDNFLSEGDVVIAISASGNSTNILNAVELANARDATTIGIVGFDGGTLAEAVDLSLHAPSTIGSYGPSEDVHMMVQHLITECLKEL